MKQLIYFIVLICSVQITHGQLLESFKDLINLDDEIRLLASNMDEIKEADVKEFWLNNPVERRNGFIGENYRRLDMKFLSIIKNENVTNEYFVYGKSRVSKNICEFQGLIRIKESYSADSRYYFSDNSGILAGEYLFYETPDCNHSGVFKGRFVTYWEKNKKGEIEYMEVPATEGNNQFSGTWTKYGNTNGIIANWGDSRIPNSGDLDVGTSEFGVNRKYQEYGWDSFLKAHGGGYDNQTMQKAREEELKKWWKE